ncbi:S-adenosyl-L-methionine-dependent methyltransferase [Artomyces pyxidatus]|uniref:S-adenosyl-L-methionine-dependent methyltransferase n=1 Tax=Artomyces pyxidatus TaxID=48021 RepID=A0ACB8TI28_9AGAM|nr:S-adenosyl-L-methionine-dependent methyltransferase [Artomyces pyxidatus]
MTSPLTALAGLISSGVQTLESAYAKEGLSFPSLDQPFSPGPLDKDPDVAATTRLIVAAAHQIIATVRAPMDTIQDYAPAMYMSATLGLAVDVNVADVLKDAGTQGLHVHDIGEKVDIDEVKLARVLRYLATRHVFKEVTPNVFSNNRISSVLVKAHPLEQLKTDKLTKYEDAPAAAFVGHCTDEALASSAFLAEYIHEAPADVDAPFNLALKTPSKLWNWYEEPGNEWRGRRFNAAMKGGGEHFPSTLFTEGYDWKSLKPGSTVVDVGGSVGTVTILLHKAYPHLKYILQDLEPVIGDAKKFWDAQSPKSITDGSVTLQAQDFFQPQTVKNADVYFLRLILHDWPDSANVKILKNIRAVAAPSTKLIIFDSIMPHACPEPGGPPPPPFPLLANLGLPIGGFLTMMDMQMLNIINGQERTLNQFVELGAVTGWKLDGVKPGILAALVFSPA